jgi:hypothetical protein
MASYYPATKEVLKAIQAEMEAGEDAVSAVETVLSQVEDEFLVDLARENMAVVFSNRFEEDIPPKPSVLDLIGLQMRTFLKQRVEENAILEKLSFVEQRTDMIHFFAGLMDHFPGLINGDEVNGCDLIDWLTKRLNETSHLKILRRWPEWDEWYLSRFVYILGDRSKQHKENIINALGQLIRDGLPQDCQGIGDCEKELLLNSLEKNFGAMKEMITRMSTSELEDLFS